MVRYFLTAGICIIAIGFVQTADAGTIIKLGLGGDGAFDIEYSGGVLSTVDDTVGATTGEQNTDIEFSDFLSSESDVPTPIASFSLSGVTKDGDAEVFGGVVVAQEFTGGTLSLYDSANVLLLSGNLNSSILIGSNGPSATGSLFTVNLGSVTSGSLANQILPNSLSISIGLNDVNGGAGFSTSGVNPLTLDDFSADATLSIAAEPIPEPTSVLMLLVAAINVATIARMKRE